MADKKTSVFGIYPSTQQAENAAASLVQAGFRSDDISVLMPDRRSSRELGTEKATKAPEGAATGVAAGGALGGTLGLLAGIGALAIPGLGPFIAAGPIVGALAGAGRRRRGRRLRRRAGRDGHPRVRSQALRRPRPRRRRAAVGAHRDVRSREHRQADPRAHGRRGHLVVGRSERGHPGRDPHRHALLRRSGSAGQPSSPGAARMWRHRAFPAAADVRPRHWLAPLDCAHAPPLPARSLQAGGNSGVIDSTRSRVSNPAFMTPNRTWPRPPSQCPSS